MKLYKIEYDNFYNVTNIILVSVLKLPSNDIMDIISLIGYRKTLSFSKTVVYVDINHKIKINNDYFNNAGCELQYYKDTVLQYLRESRINDILRI